MADEKVRVRFVTKYEQYRVSDAPFAVPIKFGRPGLSEVLNHLLNNTEDEDAQTFDFMIGSRLLRSSLNKFIALHKLSSETIIEIEYFPALTLNEESQKIELPSWVGSIQCLSDKERVVTGCYDGKCQILNVNTLKPSFEFAAHEDPIRCIYAHESDTNDSLMVLTGSKDTSINVWNVMNEKSAVKVGVLQGHVNSVESMDFWTDKQILLSGDWSGNLFGWKMDQIDMSASSAQSSVRSGKRSKANDGKASDSAEVVKLAPLFTIRAHAQNISGLQKSCGSDSGNTLFTGSWDHSIKQWDMETQDCVATLASSKVITSLNYSTSSKLVASSHPDGKVRLWDSRQPSEASCVDSFGGNTSKQWISQVKWHPSSDYHFASVDYEGTVKLWDSRSQVTLGSAEAHDGKALCLDWANASSEMNATTGTVISGGSDCYVSATSLA